MNENLKNFKSTPDPEVWGNIEKTMRRRAIRRQAITGATAAVIVSAMIAGVVLWPSHSSETALGTAEPVVAMVAENNVAQVVEAENMPAEAVQTVAAVAEKEKTEVKVNNKVAEDETPVAVASTIAEPVSQPAANTVREASNMVKSTEAKPAPSVAVVSPKQESPVKAAVEEVVAETKAEPSKASTPAKASSAISKDEDTILWIPNGFVPSQGQTFHVILNKEYSSISNFRMHIFNRQGQQVFFTTDINMAWDGTYKGHELPKAAYVCVVSYTDKDGLLHQCKATVLLIR